MKLARPSPIRVELERLPGKIFTLPVPTRGQIRRVLELDPADPESETPAAADARRAQIVAILLEGGELKVDELTAQEEVEIIHALIAQHHGLDPADSVALARVLQKKSAWIAAARWLSSMATQPPSASLSTSPAASPTPSASA